MKTMLTKEECPYCHSDGSHLDNASIWGSRPIENLDGRGYPDLYVNLSTQRLVSGDAMSTWKIKCCPECGRKLGI